MENCDTCSDVHSCDFCATDYEYDTLNNYCYYVDPNPAIPCMDGCDVCSDAASCD